jgi:hypothetical protein
VCIERTKSLDPSLSLSLTMGNDHDEYTPHYVGGTWVVGLTCCHVIAWSVIGIVFRVAGFGFPWYFVLVSEYTCETLVKQSREMFCVFHSPFLRLSSLIGLVTNVSFIGGMMHTLLDTTCTIIRVTNFSLLLTSQPRRTIPLHMLVPSLLHPSWHVCVYPVVRPCMLMWSHGPVAMSC